jgi:hypothetical protein
MDINLLAQALTVENKNDIARKENEAFIESVSDIYNYLRQKDFLGFLLVFCSFHVTLAKNTINIFS